MILSALANVGSLLSEYLCILVHHDRPSKYSCTLLSYDCTLIPTGGGRPYVFSHPSVASYIKKGGEQLMSAHVSHYVDYVDDIGCLAYPVQHGFVYADLSLTEIVPHLSKQNVQKIAGIHKIPLSSHWHLTKDELVKIFEGHDCVNCKLYISVLEAQLPAAKRQGSKHDAGTTKHKGSKHDKSSASTTSDPFPPPPATKELGETIVREWCKESRPSLLEESGCAVCAKLVPVAQLIHLKAIKTMLAILAAPGVTRTEHKSASQAISEFKGPVLDYQCNKVCDNCRKCIRKGKVPCLALANNL
ncbi:hypothetical protein L208DRAFT_1543240 [Tricholoma matsutake]|nr:hypothetical protein L208DRAFT_1543240 [Tricholoma matsutake 945]